MGLFSLSSSLLRERKRVTQPQAWKGPQGQNLVLGSGPGSGPMCSCCWAFAGRKGVQRLQLLEWILPFPQLPQKNTAALSARKGPFDSSSEFSTHLLIQRLNTCVQLLPRAGLHLWLRSQSAGPAVCLQGAQGGELRVHIIRA